MKVSVIIIAHNEEKYIRRCLESVLNQNFPPDEIVLIAHNCSDRTLEIARSFSQIKIVDYHGPEGIIYARMKGFEEIKNNVAACLDGDSFAASGWLEKITRPLEDEKIAGVGGYTRMAGSFIGWLSAWAFFFTSSLFRKDYHFYFWGSNFACRRSDYQKIGGLEPLFELDKKLHFHYSMEDVYLSLSLEKIGKVIFVPQAKAVSCQEELSFFEWMKKNRRQDKDRKKIFEFFGVNKIK